jgi:dienelactone hydrolase
MHLTAEEWRAWLVDWTDISALYLRGDFDPALRRAEEMLRRHPERRTYVEHVIACICCCAGQERRALDLAEEVSARGSWWSAHQLGDSDLDPIRQDPRFVAVSSAMSGGEAAAARQARARATEMSVIPPAGSPRAAVVALHMYGVGKTETTRVWAPLSERGVAVVVPESSFRDADDLPCWPDPDLARRDATAAVERARAEAPAAPLILAGASQGASVAVRLSVEGSADTVAAFVAVVGGGSAIGELNAYVREAGRRRLRGMFIAGERDELVRRGQERVARELTAAGIACRVEVVPNLPHLYPDDLCERVGAALPFLIDA